MSEWEELLRSLDLERLRKLPMPSGQYRGVLPDGWPELWDDSPAAQSYRRNTLSLACKDAPRAPSTARSKRSQLRTLQRRRRLA